MNAARTTNTNSGTADQKPYSYPVYEASPLNRIVKQFGSGADWQNKRFRKVRDKFGNLKPSANALQYNPGVGKYRSSYKNALRLARTEINRAYRENDWNRWQQLPFVIGFRIVNSDRKTTVCDVCKSLAGVYPKSFKFLGWHPQCMCTCVPVMCNNSDMDKIIVGQDVDLEQLPMPKE